MNFLNIGKLFSCQVSKRSLRKGQNGVQTYSRSALPRAYALHVLPAMERRHDKPQLSLELGQLNGVTSERSVDETAVIANRPLAAGMSLTWMTLIRVMQVGLSPRPRPLGSGRIAADSLWQRNSVVLLVLD